MVFLVGQCSVNTHSICGSFRVRSTDFPATFHHTVTVSELANLCVLHLNSSNLFIPDDNLNLIGHFYQILPDLGLNFINFKDSVAIF